jgi:hypothetical protein
MQLRYPNGDIYAGQHINGQKNGKGTYIYAESGIKYVGPWKSNLKDGPNGEMIYPLVEGKENRAKLIGEYKDDKLV